MAEALLFLTYLAVLLLIGILCSLISSKIKIPNMLLLILVGITLGTIHYKGQPLMQFPILFITAIGILALVIIVFDSSSRLKLKEFDTFSLSALRLTLIIFMLNLIFLTFATKYIYNVNSYFLAAIFSALMSGTSPDIVLSMLKDSKNKVIELLEIESIINTPVIVLTPFIIINLMAIETQFFFTRFIEQASPFLQQIVTGVGTGIVIGIIIFKVMRRKYSEVLSPVATITAALLTYIMAENLGGNGVLAVTTLGVFFGTIYVKKKTHLQEFSSMFANTLEILVFVLIGLAITVPLTKEFFIQSIILFFILTLIRFAAVMLSYRKETYNFKEKLFITLNAPKGIAVVVTALTLSTFQIPGLERILNLVLIFVIYSIIFSTIMTRLSKFFIRTTIIKPVPKK